MQSEDGRYSLPRWRVMRWLTDVGPDVPADIRAALIAQLFGAVPIFVGGAINSAREARDHRQPCLGELACEHAGKLDRCR